MLRSGVPTPQRGRYIFGEPRTAYLLARRANPPHVAVTRTRAGLPLAEMERLRAYRTRGLPPIEEPLLHVQMGASWT